MKQLFYLVVLLPLILNAQAQGIRFEQDLNWQAVQAKAKAANKYIFMDCSASWCAPCKEMERSIFPNEKVGDYLNDKFISITVQMDTSRKDNDKVKRWYADARIIMQQYKVKAFPTFLFFSPEGKLVHQGTGWKNADDFIALAADAANPTRQYYTLLDNYKEGKIADSSLAYLARAASVLGDGDIAQQIAREYMNQLQEKDFFTKDNIEFMRAFIQSSSDKGFSIIYKHAARVDKIMGIADYSQGIIDYIISKEEIDSVLMAASKGGPTPDWSKLTTAITRKYSTAYANRTIIAAKIRWYAFKQQWPEYTKNLVAKLEMNKGNNLDGFALNNDSWDIFQRSTDKQELNRAIYWMEKLFEEKKAETGDPATIDTYANLLYKAGKVKEGIHWEQKALAMATEKKIEDYIKTFQENLAKMKKSQPTWPTE